MKKIIINLISILLLLFTSCNYNHTETATTQEPLKLLRDSLINTIGVLEKQLSTQQTIDYKLGGEMVNAYLDFFNRFPKDDLSPNYLYKAGDVSMNLGQSEKGIELFNKVHEFYPKYAKASFALFLQGFIYETQLKDMAKARELYTLVVREYPNTKIAEDAKASIANLGKSDDELIKEFEAKNKIK